MLGEMDIYFFCLGGNFVRNDVYLMIRNFFILLEMIKERRWGGRESKKEEFLVYFNIDLGEGYIIFGKIFKLCI